MIPYPNIDPVAISLGPVQIHWYGLMYLCAFAQALWLGTYRAKRSNGLWNAEQISDLGFYCFVGVVLGGRMGYVLFYNFGYFLQDPLWLFKVWDGGMSFHGGMLGVLAAVLWYGHKEDKSFFQITDFIAPCVPLGLAFGRLGNFIGAELWGRATDLPWAMIFPTDPLQLPRHPSQLYQLFLEGIVMFVVLWLYSQKPRPRMSVSGLFLVLYGIARFMAEFVREPDAHIGFIAFGWLTMGQLLSLPMIILGVAFMVWGSKKHPLVDGGNPDDARYLQRSTSGNKKITAKNKGSL